MPALPNYLLVALANAFRAVAQYCDELAHNNTTPTPTQDTTCRVSNCPRNAVYLGRCSIHPHHPRRKVCLTCFNPSYTGHNSECPGRDFELVTPQTPDTSVASTSTTPYC
jgi:hypothetical protein